MKRSIPGMLVAATGVVLAVGALGAPAMGQQDPAAPRQPDEACVPAAIPFDEDHVQLTGRWSADDDGIYYLRQKGDTLWWLGMSDVLQEHGQIGRDFTNVATGKVNGTLLSMDFSDVPRGQIWGDGHLTLKIEPDADGNIQIRMLDGNFGGRHFVPCEPARVDVPLAIPYSYAVPFGAATATWPGLPDQKVVVSSDIFDTGLTTWVLGPGLATTCSMPEGVAVPDDHTPAAIVDYLRANPELTVGDASEATVDGHAALGVDVSTSPDASGCGERQVRLWKESGNEASLRAGATSHLTLVDVDGQTVAFERWGSDLGGWATTAQGIIDSVRFDPSSALGAAIGTTTADGAKVVKVDVLDERTRDLTIESPSVGYARVRLLLPDGFEEGSGKTYPVLYLLHGAWDDYTSWTRETDVADIPELRDVLVVMPDAGADGWYSDWSNGGLGGQPAWETFHTQELPQIVEADWGASQDRVVAGLSMGGFGALSYAARHPDMFKAAASYSGVTDTIGSDFQMSPLLWGDKSADVATWEEHSPLALAEKLKGIPLYISYGDGTPGPLDAADATADSTEIWIAPQNDRLVARLQELGIDATVDAYGHGTHSWPYWERALHASLPVLMGALGEDAPS